MTHPFNQKAQKRLVKEERKKKRQGRDWKKQPSARRRRDQWLAEGRGEDDYATRAVDVELMWLGLETD